VILDSSHVRLCTKVGCACDGDAAAADHDSWRHVGASIRFTVHYHFIRQSHLIFQITQHGKQVAQLCSIIIFSFVTRKHSVLLIVEVKPLPPTDCCGVFTKVPDLQCSKALHSFTVRSSITSNPSKREQKQRTSNPSPEGTDAETQHQMSVERSESAKKKRIVCFTRKLLVTPVIDIPIHEVRLIDRHLSGLGSVSSTATTTRRLGHFGPDCLSGSSVLCVGVGQNSVLSQRSLCASVVRDRDVLGLATSGIGSRRCCSVGRVCIDIARCIALVLVVRSVRVLLTLCILVLAAQEHMLGDKPRQRKLDLNHNIMFLIVREEHHAF
jgi:hypothetical protein